MLDRTASPLSIACSLHDRESSQRKESAAEALREAVRVRDIEDGYEFIFPEDGSAIAGVVDLVVAERACCPFLKFEILFEAAGGPIRPRVTGPDGTKEFIREELILPPQAG